MCQYSFAVLFIHFDIFRRVRQRSGEEKTSHAESSSIRGGIKGKGENHAPQWQKHRSTMGQHFKKNDLRFKYTTKFSLPKIACPAIFYAEIVVVIDPFSVGVCPLIKVCRYNPTEICQQRLQGVRNVAHKLCSWERSFTMNWANFEPTCWNNIGPMSKRYVSQTKLYNTGPM